MAIVTTPVRIGLVALMLSVQAVSGQGALTGVWASDGYGQIFEFVPDALKTFEVTGVSCIPNDTFPAVPTPPNARAAYTFPGAPIILTILPDSADGLRVNYGFAASEVVLRRMPRKPALCDRPAPDTPLSNFDVFTATFAEHYPFFSERGIDWTAVVRTNRASVTEKTTPQELFAILAGMLLPMRDAHTGIQAQAIGRTVHPVRQTVSFVPGAERQAAYAMVTPYVTGPLRAFCQGQLEFGTIRGDIGYLRIRSFSNYSKAGSFVADTADLNAALDAIFADAGSWKGLVVDVRLNGGGADPLGLLIAGRLTATSYTAYLKQARNDPADSTRWTPAQPSLVQATSRPGFRGPVVELIGAQSVSAAETFTQALLGRPTKVTRIGENTQGVFSDVMERHLPNGWMFGLPNERYMTNGKAYDVVGIAPDIPVDSLSVAARATGKDAAIEKAIEILRAGRTTGRR